jgi:hypothetical protein
MMPSATLPAGAQTSSDPDSGRITAFASIDVLNAYSFRGIGQDDDTGVVVWPQIDLGVRIYTGDGVLNRMTLRAGSWNSLHNGAAVAGGVSEDRWSESRVRVGVDLSMARGVTVMAAYSAYTSPNDAFTTVKEAEFAVALNDNAAPGRLLRPYALVAFELDTAPGLGQADGGIGAGTYLELGVSPGLSANRFEIKVPVKLGLSLDRYYELAGRDRRFGFASAAGVVRVRLGGRTSLGAWSIHGGVEYQALGEMTKAINLGDGSNVIGSIGLGWSR